MTFAIVVRNVIKNIYVESLKRKRSLIHNFMTPQEAAVKYPQFIKLAEDGALEFYLDNQMLSTLRLCEQKFVEEYMECLHGRGVRAWNLDFGLWYHSSVEWFYKYFRRGKRINATRWLRYAGHLWNSMDMDYYQVAEPTKYKNLGGREGALALLGEYYCYYFEQRMRVIATEIYFGRGKEVLIGEWTARTIRTPEMDIDEKVRCYLTGRIDLLVDNGYKIGPVDHKTTARFDGLEYTKFNPHDGITGYIFAINRIMGERFPEFARTGKLCQSAWVFHISTSSPKPPALRFKTTQIDKTPEQLEEYRLRQLRSFQKLYQLVVEGTTPDWNTNACPNIYNRPCPHKVLHEAPARERSQIIQTHYERRKPWNPEEPGNSYQEKRFEERRLLLASRKTETTTTTNDNKECPDGTAA